MGLLSSCGLPHGPTVHRQVYSYVEEDKEDNTLKDLSDEPILWTGKSKDVAINSYETIRLKYKAANDNNGYLGARELSRYGFVFSDSGPLCAIKDGQGGLSNKMNISITPERPFIFFDYQLQFEARLNNKGQGLIFQQRKFVDGLYPKEDDSKTNFYLNPNVPQHVDIAERMLTRLEECGVELTVFEKE